MMGVRRTARFAILILVAVLSAPARRPTAREAGPGRPGARPPTLIVAPGTLAVVADGEVHVRAADGRRLFALPPAREPGRARAADASGGARAAAEREEIWDRYRVPEASRDSQAAEDLADDELTLGARRAARPGAGPLGADEPAPALAAAGPDALWVIAGRGLYRLDAPAGAGAAAATASRAGLAPATAARVAPAAATTSRVAPGVASAARVAPAVATPIRVATVPAAAALAVSGDGGLLIARGSELAVSQDSGRSWRTVGTAPAVIDALVAGAGAGTGTGTGTGVVAWTSAGELTIAVPGAEPASYRPPAAIRGLHACGADLVIVADDGVHVAAGRGPPIRAGGPLPGSAFACAADGAGPWLAVGPGLLVSHDRGRSWWPRLDAPAVLLAAAAVGHGRLWLLALAGDLLDLPLEQAPAPAPGAGAPAPALAEPIARIGRRGPWLALLPHLTLTASHSTRGARRDTRALVLADFTLPARGTLARDLRLAAVQAAAQTEASAPPPMPAPPPPPAPAPPSPFALPGAAPRGDRTAAAELACLATVRAQAVARAQAEPERARSLVARAGRSAWLPELRVRVERRLGRAESLDVKPTASADAVGLDTADDVRYEVRATWDLPRLVFDPDEVAAQQQALRMSEIRREIESQVNRLYFERRRLGLQPPPGPAEEREQHQEQQQDRQVRMDELAAELDAVSGGAFSRCLEPGP